MLRRTSLFSKILSISGVILSGAILILISSIYVQNKLEEQALAKDVQLGLLDAQRRLSDFQFRGNKSQLDSIINNRNQINDALNDLGKSAQVEEIKNLANRFFDKFENLIDLCMVRGLDENSGVEGEFREKIHDAQLRIKDLNNMEAELVLLELRRREKDFIMRGDRKYTDSVKTLADKLSSIILRRVKNTDLQDELLKDINDYKVSFMQLADIMNDISLVSKELNDLNEDLMKKGIALNNDKSEQASIVQFAIFSFMAVILIVSIILSFWLSKRISQPISNLKNAANRMASGELDIDLEESKTKDEVHDLSVSFKEMVSQIRQRTDELVSSNEQLKILNSEINQQQLLLKEQSEKIEKNNKKLKTQNIELENLITEKNEFLGIVSHDLKNPLQSIKLAAQLLKNDASLTKNEVEEFSADILTSAARMFELIKNLLDANAVEQGKVQVSLGDFDADIIVRSIISSYQHKAEQKNISIEYKSPALPIFLYGDSGLTLQVLDNLVSNAIKYSPFDSTVRIEIEQGNNTSLGKISIIDQGPGLSHEDQQKLFSKFTRLTPKPTGGEHSTGLGLSIVKKLAEMMNGKVECNSELGLGSTFILSLPITNDILVN